MASPQDEKARLVLAMLLVVYVFNFLDRMLLSILAAPVQSDLGLTDGQMGLLDLAGNATLLYYMSEEAKEGKNAYVEKRKPDFSKFPRVP